MRHEKTSAFRRHRRNNGIGHAARASVSEIEGESAGGCVMRFRAWFKHVEMADQDKHAQRRIAPGQAIRVRTKAGR
jgi:hypothetical protein